MRYVHVEKLGIRISKAVCAKNETALFETDRPLRRCKLTTTQYWAGDFRYEKPDGSTLADITRGMIGLDLPDFPEAGVYTLRAMTDGAFYYCMTRLDRGPLQKERIDLPEEGVLVVPQGRIAFVDDGTEVKIVVTAQSDTTIVGPAKGLVVWYDGAAV